jgi:exopolysaccharide biosynthesis polyprenyl glycosylphosphotransferase
MVGRRSTSYTILLLVSDLLLTEAALYIASVARRNIPVGMDLGPERLVYLPSEVYLIVLCLWSFLFVLLSVYDTRRSLRMIDELQRVIVAVGVGTLVLAGVLYLSFRDVSRLLFVYFFIFDLISLVGLRLLMRLALLLAEDKTDSTTKVLIIGAGKVGREVARMIKGREWSRVRAIGYLDDDPEKRDSSPEGLPVLGALTEAVQVVQDEKVDEVILALPFAAQHKMVGLITELQRLPVDVEVVPDLFDLAFHHASIDRLGGIPLIGLRAPAIDGFQRMVKRAFDLIVAVPLFVLLSPLMLTMVILIKLDSHGPAIFKQERVGENCRKFFMYKFRSMVEDAEARLGDIVEETGEGSILHKRRDDPRVTRVGRMLRRTSLDELPQLFNVIKGEMSLVGPRPELPFLVEQYEPWQLKRFVVPSGMTGWWQISGRSDRPMHLHVEEDLYYIQNYSLLLDIKILWRTIGVVLQGRGAY